MSKVRIGFVGVGAMGQCAHLKNYVTLPDCEVVALAEVRTQLGERVARKYGVPRVYPDHEALLAAEELDGLVASQPFTHHATLIPELLESRVPVFIEKPLAGSIANGERIVRAVAESGTWLMVGYHKRSDPATMYAKAQVDRLAQSGEWGAFRYVRITMPPGDYIAGGFDDLLTTDQPGPALQSDPAAPDMDEATYEAYLSLVNYYIHQLNLLRHLLGESYTVTHADPSGVLLVARSDSGVCGVIEMSPYSTSRDWQESVWCCFERGYVKLELPAPLACNRPGRVELFCDPGQEGTPQTVMPTLPSVSAMRRQAANFVAALRGERSPMCEAAEALEDLVNARQYLDLRMAAAR